MGFKSNGINDFDIEALKREQEEKKRLAKLEEERAAAEKKRLEEEALKQTELAQKLTKDAYAKLHHDMQHFVNEATVEQLNQIKEGIASCAHKAMLAGIDAIEVHGDRLLGSLCSEVLNHRSDAYGGSFENRIRLCFRSC